MLSVRNCRLCLSDCPKPLLMSKDTLLSGNLGGVWSEEHFQELVAHLFNNPDLKKKLISIMYPVCIRGRLYPLNAFSLSIIHLICGEAEV